jgi:hypothetical protein
MGPQYTVSTAYGRPRDFTRFFRAVKEPPAVPPERWQWQNLNRSGGLDAMTAHAMGDDGPPWAVVASVTSAY